MSLQEKLKTNQSHLGFNYKVRIILVVSLIIISLFPLFITIAPQEWPLSPRVLLIDAAYLVLLAGYAAVLTGINRSRGLVIAMIAVSVVGVCAMGWLLVALGTLRLW